mgnify:CR=1 FL=1
MKVSRMQRALVVLASLALVGALACTTEVIREVPVEKIVTQEVIKEVPVDRIVEVTKEVVRTVEVDRPVQVVKKVVRETVNFGLGRFCCADIHTPVYLAGICRNYFSI